MTDISQEAAQCTITGVLGISAMDAYNDGLKKGAEWAASASHEALVEAAKRDTTNHQIKQHLKFYVETIEDGEIGDEILYIAPPYDSESYGDEIADYFNALVEQNPCYQGEADYTRDPDIRVENYFISGMPVAAFRSFEDGWTHAVRQYLSKLSTQ